MCTGSTLLVGCEFSLDVDGVGLDAFFGFFLGGSSFTSSSESVSPRLDFVAILEGELTRFQDHELWKTGTCQTRSRPDQES